MTFSLAILQQQTKIKTAIMTFDIFTSDVAGITEEDPVSDNNVASYTQDIKYDVNLALNSVSLVPKAFYNDSVTSPPKNQSLYGFTDLILGGEKANFKHEHKIQNDGPNTISSLTTIFSWPSQTKDGFILAYLYNFKCLPTTLCQCEIGNKVDSLLLTENSQPLDVLYPQENSLPSLVTCDDVQCESIQCYLTNIPGFTKVKIEASFKLWQPTLTHSSVQAKLVSSVAVDTSGLNFVTAMLHKSEAATDIIKYSPPAEISTTNITALVVGVVVGFGLLAATTYILWKRGFFKSKFDEELQATSDFRKTQKQRRRMTNEGLLH